MKRKYVVYNTVGASLLLTGAIVWLSGVDLAEVALAEVRAVADAIETATVYPVVLPVWAVALLSIPTIWFLGIGARSCADAFRGVVAWRPAIGFRPRWRRTPPAEPRTVADEFGPDTADAAVETSVEMSPPVREGYFEDALFGVVWRWPSEPEAGDLSAHCAACDEALVPWANGGSLSRGLHCERCNKLRAAGEHPDEVFEKVASTLSERKRTGEWRSAPRRVNGAQSAATRPLASLPAA